MNTINVIIDNYIEKCIKNLFLKVKEQDIDLINQIILSILQKIVL